ncbi:hypothetical protein [Candidatus Lokiarchaeum ossiferum]|uniref:hypothetical protein n=1 Tax=Candidatus Lokiarchaeum ossiferum TaxID=2951803 RepID=UPI00352D0359
MGFNIGRALIVGFLYYIFSIIIIFPLTPIFPDFIILVWWMTEMFFVFLLSNYIYFRKSSNTKGIDGIYLGLFLIVLTFIFDILFYIFAMGEGWLYLLHWAHGIRYIILIIVPFLTALLNNQSYYY